jgi:hypothetical protein
MHPGHLRRRTSLLSMFLLAEVNKSLKTEHWAELPRHQDTQGVDSIPIPQYQIPSDVQPVRDVISITIILNLSQTTYL